MPVVNADWRDPVSWAKPRVSYGMVKDGDVLRACRISKSGKKTFMQCKGSAWGENKGFRPRFEKERQSGALLAVGVEPHRVMLRNLESPLKDKSKSTEIWGTLLDAAIPFSLEKCQVAFLPAAENADGNLRCLAVAARLQDLEDLLAEWHAWGVEPDLIFPEELMFSGQPGDHLWKGETRSVFSIWKEGGYVEGGGALKYAQRSKVLARYEQSRSPDAEPLSWQSVGPDAGREPGWLEQALATNASRPDVSHANLLAEPLAAPALLLRYQKKRKTLKAALLIFLFLLVIFPLFLRQHLRANQKAIRSEIASAYQQYTGSVSVAPGQEVLLAKRYRDEKWNHLWESVQNLSQPKVANLLVELTAVAQEKGLTFLQISLRNDAMELQVIGSEEALETYKNYLNVSGWTLKITPGEEGAWSISGRRGA
ncbi:hypothetical protein P0Y35_12025 [Kiritimatiellaeota bacterium B1221]|nr:hypothetical protein [Kiritimatiellaeota bacterium B1221]